MEYTQVKGRGQGFEDVYRVRYAVFVEEQGYSPESENEEQDDTCIHLLALDEGRPVATCRLFQDEEGNHHIGRVAVLEKYRGRGLGSELMRRMLDVAKQKKAKTIVLGAQYDKTRFYELLGFVKTGERYLDEGYPHDMMRLEL